MKNDPLPLAWTNNDLGQMKNADKIIKVCKIEKVTEAPARIELATYSLLGNRNCHCAKGPSHGRVNKLLPNIKFKIKLI
jgi:hypothetical protein